MVNNEVTWIDIKVKKGLSGHPRYSNWLHVQFYSGDETNNILEGKILTIDPYGTFGNPEEPSYDIEVSEDGIYQHIQESHIVALGKRGDQYWIDPPFAPEINIEQYNEKFKDKYYKLVDVQTNSGESKIKDRQLYVDRVNCIGKDLHIKRYNDSLCLAKISFIYNEKNKCPIRLKMRTSSIMNVIFEANGLRISTANSIYVFENAEYIVPVLFKDEKNLIELYLDSSYDKFVFGRYTDAEGTVYELQKHMHLGIYTDSCLVSANDGEMPIDFVCRYFATREAKVEFYDTFYGQQPYETTMLIHNVSDKDLEVSFPTSDEKYVVKAHRELRIEP